MPSKWIKELADKGKLDLQQLIDMKEVLVRIQSLLFRAKLSTDDEYLYEDLSKELKED